MANNLEEIHEKFHAVQEALDNGFYHFTDSSMLMDFAGTICEYCSTNGPFERWYSETGITHQHLFNEILAQKNVPKLTESDLREYYEHTRNNLEKSCGNGMGQF